MCVFGESCTGKELVARAIPTAACGFSVRSLPSTARSPERCRFELFFQREGPTGPPAAAGCFEQANGGTLCSESWGEMSINAGEPAAPFENTIRRVWNR